MLQKNIDMLDIAKSARADVGDGFAGVHSQSPSFLSSHLFRHFSMSIFPKEKEAAVASADSRTRLRSHCTLDP
jgi:hypothetical protein